MPRFLRINLFNAKCRVAGTVAGLAVALFSTIMTIAACRRPPAPEDPTVWNKVRLNFRRLDADGLAGPPGGKVAVNYEFCIPADAKTLREVQRIDTTARRYPGKGRVQCTDQEWLVLGSTHQPRYQRVLYELAALPYVREIQETFWE